MEDLASLRLDFAGVDEPPSLSDILPFTSEEVSFHASFLTAEEETCQAARPGDPRNRWWIVGLVPIFGVEEAFALTHLKLPATGVSKHLYNMSKLCEMCWSKGGEEGQQCKDVYLSAVMLIGLITGAVFDGSDQELTRFHQVPVVVRHVDGALVDATEESEEEVQVWKDAYQLELERADLLDEQLKAGSMFCPKRYPDFVAPEYRWFQTWDTIQQMTKLVNHHFGELAWFAFHGVGDPHASVSRAVLFTLSRQLFGHKVSVLGTTPTAGLWFAEPWLSGHISRIMVV
eukprot:g13855.t1